ncbi:sulfotransferase domain-containing protein [Sulfurimonas indica]|uniref:sulfotransferase domain-containing protein n=1 Tax=Sulfurimonas indica TaxID=2508707 RepID=UPI0012640D39|nr:sulfotransferase domain-containing protein [Sulfurimonas indica]
MYNDIYVVGYPKSGNTWLARLLSEVTNSPIQANDIINTADNDKRNGNFKIHKIHDSKNFESIVKSNKVVYIVRDVRDVLISGFFFNYPMFTEEQVKNNFFIRKYFNYEIKRLNKQWQGNILVQLIRNTEIKINNFIGKQDSKALIGSWSEHIERWTNNPNCIMIKYEDMLNDTFKELEKVINFLNLDINPNILEQTVKNQSFEKKKQEFIKKGDTVNAKFMRSGKSEKWCSLLNSSLENKIIQRHKHYLSSLKYIRNENE